MIPKESRSSVESLFKFCGQLTFYHNFPLLYAMSFDTPLELSTDKEGRPSILYEGIQFFGIDKNKKAYISSYKSTSQLNHLFDKNYIYELDQVTNLKNFKANVKKFRKNNDYEYLDADDSNSIRVISHWYKTHHLDHFDDYGYTYWFAKNPNSFSSIHSNIVMVNDRPACFSVWGELDDECAVHIISKDTGIPYTQDFTRMIVYNEMIEEGFRYVNDGSDMELSGLRQYKLKLRPFLIIPIWSWGLQV